MDIKFLRDVECGVFTIRECGIGSCSWLQHTGHETFKAGNIEDSNLLDLDELEEFEDYVYLN